LIIVYINRSYFQFPKIDSRFWQCTV